MAKHEWKFSSLGKYAPHIFDDPCRKLKRFVGRLRNNIQHFVVASDPETFTRAVRIAHLIEEEHGRFLEEQKRAGKRPTQQLEEKDPRQDQRKVQKVQEPSPVIQPGYTICERCGHSHLGRECWRCARKCFKCRDRSHKVANYKNFVVGRGEGQLKPPIKGRVFALTDEEEEDVSLVTAGMFSPIIDIHARV